MSMNRRDFLARTTALAAGALMPATFPIRAWAGAPAKDTTAQLSTYNWGNPSEAKAYSQAFERFRKVYPNVTVQDNIAPISSWSDYADKLVTQIAGGNPPDIINIAIESVRLAVDKQLLRPLDDLIAADPEAKALVDKIPAKLKDALTVDGKLYEIPNGAQTMVIHYNTRIFKEAGLEPPKPDWTWDDFLAIAKKLTIGEGDKKVYGYGLPWFNFAIHPWYLTNGTYPVTADFKHSNLNDPKILEVAKFIHSLVYEHGVSPDPIGLNVYDQFAAGRFAMVGAGRWPVTGWAANGFTDFDIVPWPRKETAATVFGCGGWGISPQSKNPELAFEAIKQLISLETVTALMEIGQQIPIYEEAAKTESFLSAPKSAPVFFEALTTAKPVASPAFFNTLDRILGRTFDQIITEEMTPEEALAAAHEELEAEIQRS